MASHEAAAALADSMAALVPAGSTAGLVLPEVIEAALIVAAMPAAALA
jgi:hypothetical protein